MSYQVRGSELFAYKVFTMLCHSAFGMFGLQEAMKKKLEIQKQKQELLNKQIQEQKVTRNIPS